MDTLTLVLSSTLISGLVSALVSGWFNLQSKKNEYANAYYKLILDRRLDAYEEVEKLIGSIKVAVVDAENRPYHLLFSKDDDHTNVYQVLAGTMSKALWLSDDLFELTRQLNLLVYGRAKDEVGLIEFGKLNYKTVSDLRTNMEKIHLRDMLTLHDAPGFLKSKRPAESFGELSPRGQRPEAK